MFAFVLLCFFAIAIFWFYKLLTPSSKEWKYGNEMPGPSTLSIIGNDLISGQSKTMIGKLAELYGLYGPVFRIWLGKRLLVVLCDPDDYEKFLSRPHNLNKSDWYNLAKRMLGNTGLITAKADVWHVHRKVLTPRFHFKVLESYLPVFEKNARIMCEQLKSKSNGPEFDLHSFIEKCTFDVICETAMGIKQQAQTTENVPYFHSLKNFADAFAIRMPRPWLYPEFLFKLTKTGKIYMEAIPMIKAEDKKVIRERKNTLQNMNEEKALEDEKKRKEKKAPKSFLDFLLTESKFTDEEIEDEVQTFLFAGHDTTTGTLEFCCYELSRNQDVQEKLFQEIKDVLNKDSEPNYHDYMNMKYLDNVIKETLRKYPAVALPGRITDEDFKLTSGYTIPANAMVGFFILGTHMDEKYFPNPEQFQPERFENRVGHTYSFVPFSAGPRNCIGQKFALLEMKVILSTLLMKYQILPVAYPKSLTLEMKMTLTSLEKINLKIIPRDLQTS